MTNKKLLSVIVALGLSYHGSSSMMDEEMHATTREKPEAKTPSRLQQAKKDMVTHAQLAAHRANEAFRTLKSKVPGTAAHKAAQQDLSLATRHLGTATRHADTVSEQRISSWTSMDRNERYW